MKEKVKQVISAYYKKYKGTPRIMYVSEYLNISARNVLALYDALVQENFLFKENKKYTVNPDKMKNIHIVENTSKRVNTLDTTALVVYLIRSVMFFVSIVAICISVYYSKFWLDNFLSTWLSFSLALSLVLFSSFAPQALMYAFNMSKVIGSVVLFSACVVLLFSMLSTIAGQYNVRSDLLREDTKKESKTIKQVALLDMLKKEESTILDSIERLEKEVNIYRDQLSEYTKEDTQTHSHKVLVWKIGQKQNEIVSYETKLQEKRDEIKKYLNKTDTLTETIERKDFYSWLSGLLRISPGVIEFILFMFPAVFVDIIAPLGLFLSIGLFARKEKEGKEK